MSAHKKEVAHLTEETLVEYKAHFDNMDFQNTGKISVLDIAPLMRKLGLMPSNVEIEEMVGQIEKDKNAEFEGVTFEQFCNMAAQKYNDVYTEVEICDAFRTFDLDGNGYLSQTELRRALCSMGEKLTEDEFEAMIENAPQDAEGNILYEEFVHNMSTE
ncbi:unnamed protein product [Calicophoron daubneyi]|uniref:EF-hand domain-containing protein n=1 Tax=Calicophoron daubneyi TaxID=300641 RepID=A0AAV2T5D4_CALDB